MNLPMIESTYGDYPRLIGECDGVNATFQTHFGAMPHAPFAWFKNGVMIFPGTGDGDYHITWGLVGKAVFNTPPLDTDNITVMYWPIGG